MNVPHLLARKYARAFLAVARGQFTLDMVSVCSALAHALEESKMQMQRIMALMHEKEQQKVMEQVVAQSGLPAAFGNLIRLLIQEKRLILLPLVLEQIVDLYKEQEGILMCTVTSSHPLDATLRAAVQQFLARATGRVIMEQYVIDKSLIAGIRMRSDTVLWEYSIDKQLKAIARLSGRGSYGN